MRFDEPGWGGNKPPKQFKKSLYKPPTEVEWARNKYTYSALPWKGIVDELKGIKLQTILTALKNDDRASVVLILMKMADVTLRRMKDEVLIENGMDRQHFITDEQIEESEQIEALLFDVFQIAYNKEPK
jgi:hypothetical protein